MPAVAAVGRRRAHILDVCDVLLWPRAGMGQRGDPPLPLAPWGQMPACVLLR